MYCHIFNDFICWWNFIFEVDNLQPLFKNGAIGFVQATGFVFVAFAGVDKVAAIAEEVKDPTKNLPSRYSLIAIYNHQCIYNS